MLDTGPSSVTMSDMFIMSAMGSSHARLQSFKNTWSPTKALRFLDEDAPFPPPTQGPLHELLVTTLRLLPDSNTINKQTADDAVTSEATLMVVTLATWLQQQPDKLMMPNSSLCYNVWARLLTVIRMILAQQALTPDTETAYKFLHQLHASGE